MLVRLHVVIDTEDTGIEEEIKEQLRSYCPDISFSPSREQPSLMHCMEFYSTVQLEKEQAEVLWQTLNNDWDGKFDDCDAYGFNTIMFHPHVYYLQFQIQ
ncbi:MAG: hypothetical protein SO150_04100 [Faecalicoccus sp.]|uniref:hypothetical protein n=2 Tax=Faecalicoccus TaxID=1573536 RepID=UPI002A804757|nr:hypothetical protein [Faecalicoccus sp.]MCI6379649.1 hypothetical protein [Erysipelotrichaceae bacterium]MDY4869510.1 hypothetical protein [Faecalicoccus sp.]